MGKPKFEMTERLMESECKARCVWIDSKRHRRMMTRMRGGTAELGIEVGRWHGVRREDRVCKYVEVGITITSMMHAHACSHLSIGKFQ